MADSDERTKEESPLLDSGVERMKIEKTCCGMSLYARNYVAFFILGTVNNLGYVVVLVAAQDLARHFNKENLIGMIPWANVGLGLLVRSLNAFVLEKTPYGPRMFANGLSYLFGAVGLAFSVYMNFFVSIGAIVLVGCASSFGESVLLGFLRLYAPQLVGGWSSGTGVAGVGGALYYLVLAAIGVDLFWIFMSLVPFIIFYEFTFFVIVRKPASATPSVLIGGQIEEEEVVVVVEAETKGTDHVDAASLKVVLSDDPAMSGIPSKPVLVETMKQKTWRCLKAVWVNSLQLALVYFFEYVIQTGCADKAEPKSYRDSSNFFEKHAFVILQFCYQLGVLISRSSLKFVKIRRIEWLTILQGLNLVLWILQDVYKFMPLWLQFIAMFYVGLLGGAMYVNVFYLILEDDSGKIMENDKELCMNIGAIFINIGIVLSCVFVLIMDNTFLEKY